MREVVIIGAGIHEFGRYSDRDYRYMGSIAVKRALDDAKIKLKDIEAAFCGNVFNTTCTGHNVLATIGMTGIPIVNVENACASGGSAFRQAYHSIASGQYDVVLAMGVEQSPRGFLPGAGWEDWQSTTGLGVNPLYFALNIRRHMEEYGITAEHLAKVSEKNHRNGVNNPYAMYHKEFSVEEILNSRMVCDPLTLLMLCAPDDGAAAVVLCSKEKAAQYTGKFVNVAASVLIVQKRADMFMPAVSAPVSADYPTLTERAAAKAYEMAGLGPEDLDLVELQDTDSGSEIIYTERLGLCPKGEGGRLLDEGATEIGGRIPVNVSGGLLSKGEPVGASSLAQVSEIVWQLRGEAGPRQVKNAKVGLSHTEGAGGNSNIIILKR